MKGLEGKAWFYPLQTSKHTVTKLIQSLMDMFQRSLSSEFSSQASTCGLVGLFEILAQTNF